MKNSNEKTNQTLINLGLLKLGLTPNAVILAGIIKNLSRNTGYCFAKNDFILQYFGGTIKITWLKQLLKELKDAGILSITLFDKSKNIRHMVINYPEIEAEEPEQEQEQEQEQEPINEIKAKTEPETETDIIDDLKAAEAAKAAKIATLVEETLKDDNDNEYIITPTSINETDMKERNERQERIIKMLNIYGKAYDNDMKNKIYKSLNESEIETMQIASLAIKKAADAIANIK